MSEPNPEAVRAALSEVVEHQMRDGDPPETKETYDRLIADGHVHDETMRLTSHVVLFEMNDCTREEQPFNKGRFVVALNALPELSWDDLTE